MRTYFKLELKKNLFSLKTIIISLILLTSLIEPLINKISFSYPGLDGVDYYIKISHFSYIVFIGPSIIGLIYSTSIITDKKSEFWEKVLDIIDIKTYYKTKVMVNLFLTSSIFIVCHGVIIVYLIFRFGVNNVPSNEINVVALKNIYEMSKILYIFLLLVIIAISSSAFSIFVMGLATATNRKMVAYVFPPFYMITTGILFELASINDFIDFNVTKLFGLIIYNSINVLNVLLYALILIILGLIILYKFSYKKNLMILNKTS